MTAENIIVNTQSSIRIQGSKVLYFDPLEIAGTPHDADIIFITHDHYDHFSPEDIRKIAKTDTVLVVPAQIEQTAYEKVGPISIIAVYPHCRYSISEVNVEAVPAYNKIKPFHPKKKEWCGFVVELQGIYYYVAGDTDCLEENYKIHCDVALVPIGGTYTMDVTEAAKFINEIRPQIAVPTHYGSIVGKPEDGERFKEIVNPKTDVRILLK